MEEGNEEEVLVQEDSAEDIALWNQQRIDRGYSDRDRWSFDLFLCKMLADVLPHFKNSREGQNAIYVNTEDDHLFFPDDKRFFVGTKKERQAAMDRWDQDVDNTVDSLRKYGEYELNIYEGGLKDYEAAKVAMHWVATNLGAFWD